jgi:hypothetical protein
MEQKDIALKASLANKLATLVHSHQLPVNLIVGKPIDHLRTITITYHECDELLIEWLLFRIEQEDIYD